MALTGQVYNDVDQDGIYTAGTDSPFSGVTISVVAQTGGDHFSAQTTTDGSGNYSINDAGMTVGNRYKLTVGISDEWGPTAAEGIYGNPSYYNMSAYNEIRNGPFIQYVTRIVTSSWVVRIAWLPGDSNTYPTGNGVRVTFKSNTKHKGKKFFTCRYPGAIITDYNNLVAAASKGHKIHESWFKGLYVMEPVVI